MEKIISVDGFEEEGVLWVVEGDIGVVIERGGLDINIVFSFDVIYKDNNVLIFDSCEGCTYIDKGGRKRAGKKFIILTKQAYYTYTQTAFKISIRVIITT